ncbi:MAG: Electron transport complex protein RnfC [Firmicutes bacterium ADurb.Bin193]|nr:MAG: Electron transport complex protein RnfC [Firmicutes bacterium ADurb.Bin193]
MLFRTFKGGVHLHYNKEHTNRVKIVDMPAPDKIICPLSQHTGKQSEPTVKAGDRVKIGSLIGKQCGYVSANQHSPVSGTVMAVEPYLHPCGSMIDSVIIENDGKDEVFEGIKPYGDISELSAKDIIDIVSNAGIVGLGGAAFPTHVKLCPPPDTRIETLIINGAECEPYLTADHRIMLEYTDELMFGCMALVKAVDAKVCVIAIESNKKDAILAIKEKISSAKSGIRVVGLATKYPQGSEKQIVSAVTGKEVPPCALPADVGVVVVNVHTCVSTALAIKTGMPLTSRVVTVAGSAISNPGNFKVRIGTPIKHLIEAAGGFKGTAEKIIIGGPMMGTSVYSLDIPIIKGAGGVLALTERDVAWKTSSNCIHCGKCVGVCPVRLEPVTLDRYYRKFNAEMLEKYNLFDCIECGSCVYICPARVELLRSIRGAKRRLAQMRESK